MYFDTHIGTTWGEVAAQVAANLRPAIQVLGLFLQPDEVIELRVVERRNGRVNPIANGYFDDPIKLAAAAIRYDQQPERVYVTLNPVRRDLLTATGNRLRQPARWIAGERDATRHAAMVIKYESVDANNQDHRPAQERAMSCRDMLRGQGWTEPIVADSDRGTHLLYALDLPNNAQSRALICGVMDKFAGQFGDGVVGVDRGACNPALMCPLYGLSGRSGVTYVPPQFEVVDQSLLEALVPPPPPRAAPAAITRLPVDGPPQPRQFGPVPLTIEAINEFVPGKFIGEAEEVAATSRHLDALDDDNGIVRFVRDECVLETVWTPSGTLHGEYDAFCYVNELPPFSASHFARMLVNHYGLVADRRKVKGKVVRGIWGIRLRSVPHG